VHWAGPEEDQATRGAHDAASRDHEHDDEETTMSTIAPTERLDCAALGAELERLLRLRANPFGMKMFERLEDMEAIPKLRRPKSVHTVDQVVAQAARLGSDRRHHRRGSRGRPVPRRGGPGRAG
jgi:hypothetical protein